MDRIFFKKYIKVKKNNKKQKTKMLFFPYLRLDYYD